MISLFVGGLTLIPIFLFYELKIAKNPLLDIHLFSNRNIPIACLINFTTGAAYFGAIFFLPRYFMDIKNSSLTTAALQMLGIMLSLAVSTVFAANLISQTGQLRLVGFIGGVLYAISSGVVLMIARNTPSANVILWSILMGFGSGIMYQPAIVVGSMSVKPHQMAVISAFMGFLRTLGGTFAIALLTVIFETRFTTILRGEVPEELVNQGLGLADNHSQYPQYSDPILDAMIKAYHDGSVPGIAMGVAYAVCIACLQNIDFVPARKRERITSKWAIEVV
jgi:MFS family permease